jgi:hypothetical protein
MATPIQTWPTITHRGRPGYSRKYFAAMAGAQDDPLRIAERIAHRRIGEEVNAAASARVANGHAWSTVIEWQTREISRRVEAKWQELCGSFEAVLAELKTAPPTPAMKRAIAQCKRAAT